MTNDFEEWRDKINSRARGSYEDGRIDGLIEAAKIVAKYKPLEWLANEILKDAEG